MGVADVVHEDPEQESCHESHAAVGEAAAEDDAESRAAQGRGEDLLQRGFGLHGANLFQALLHLVEGAQPLSHFARELVDGHHLVEAGAFDGDELAARIAIGRGHDAVAEHEETLVVNAEVAGDALHGFLHARNLRAVLQKDGTGLVSHVHRPAAVTHRRIHAAKLQKIWIGEGKLLVAFQYELDFELAVGHSLLNI